MFYRFLPLPACRPDVVVHSLINLDPLGVWEVDLLGAEVEGQQNIVASMDRQVEGEGNAGIRSEERNNLEIQVGKGRSIPFAEGNKVAEGDGSSFAEGNKVAEECDIQFAENNEVAEESSIPVAERHKIAEGNRIPVAELNGVETGVDERHRE